MVSEIVHRLIDGEREDFQNGLQRLLNRVPRRGSTTEPEFSTYFFLGSVLTLPYTKLNGEIGVKASSVKITSDETVKLVFKIEKDGKTKLVFRTIAIGDKIDTAQKLTVDEFKEALGSLDLTQDELNNCEVEGEIVHIESIKEKRRTKGKKRAVIDRKVSLKGLEIIEKGELNSETLRKVMRDQVPLPEYDEQKAKFKKVKDGIIEKDSLGDALKQFSEKSLKAGSGELSESSKGAEAFFENLSKVYGSQMKLGLEEEEEELKKLGLSDYEAPAHGFVYGALAMNFRYEYALRIRPEQAAGKGFVDLVVGSHGREFRVELKGRTNTAQDAERQSGREGYDKAPIIFNFGEEEKAKSVTMVFANLCLDPSADGLLVRESPVPPKPGGLIELFKKHDGENLKEELKKKLNYLYYSISDSNGGGENTNYLSRLVLGELLAGNSLEKHVVVYDDNELWNSKDYTEPIQMNDVMSTFVLKAQDSKYIILNVIERENFKIDKNIPLPEGVDLSQCIQVDIRVNPGAQGGFEVENDIDKSYYQGIEIGEVTTSGSEYYEGKFEKVDHVKLQDITNMVQVQGFQGALYPLRELIILENHFQAILQSLLSAQKGVEVLTEPNYSSKGKPDLLVSRREEDGRTHVAVVELKLAKTEEEIEKRRKEGEDQLEKRADGLETVTKEEKVEAAVLVVCPSAEDNNKFITHFRAEGLNVGHSSRGSSPQRAPDSPMQGEVSSLDKTVEGQSDKSPQRPVLSPIDQNSPQKGLSAEGFRQASGSDFKSPDRTHEQPGSFGYQSRKRGGFSSDQSEGGSPLKKYRPSNEEQELDEVAFQSCSSRRRKRDTGKTCIDSRDEESAEEKKGKEELIKELFDSDEIRERIKNIEFYDQLYEISEKISRGETISKNSKEVLVERVKDINLDSIDPEIRGIVVAMKNRISRRSTNKVLRDIIQKPEEVAEKIRKVEEGEGLYRTVFLTKGDGFQASNPEIMGHLNRIGKVSGWAMEGMMYKNLIGDILSDNLEGVAINLGFIAGGPMLSKAAEAASAKGLKLVSEGKVFLGKSLRIASPFLAHFTTGFIVYDLVNQVKAYKAGNKDAMVGIVGDSVVIAVDVAEIGVEVAEITGVLEGVSSITGPIGAAIGAIVFIGTDIYLAVRTVEKEDKIIHLTGWEKFKEGWRASFHISPEQYIEELIGEKEVNNQLVKSGIKLLKRDTDIQRYVFPTGRSVVDSCRTIKQQIELCSKGSPIDGKCPMGTGIYKTYESEKCNTKIQLNLKSTVSFSEKMDIFPSRTSPDNPEEGELFCLPLNTAPRCDSISVFDISWGDCQSSNAYYCDSAIGVSYTNGRTGNYTLIALGKGKDVAVGFKGSPNVFLVEDGEKRFFGGDKDDIFVLSGSEITGILDGGGGNNTVDFGKFYPRQEPLSIDSRLSVDDLQLINMSSFLGRGGKRDVIGYVPPKMKYIDGRGGKDKDEQDTININYFAGYSNEVQIAVRPYTIVRNIFPIHDKFTYVIHQGKGEASIDLMEIHIFSSHSLLFDYALKDIKTVSYSSARKVEFTFLLSSNLSSISISLPFRTRNIFYALNDGTKIKISDKGNLYALQNTDKPVDKIIEDYPAIANRLNMTIAVQSSNESIIIGHGKHEILYNNPEYDSHLVGNGGENVYVIVPTKRKLSIYDVDEESSIDTLDLSDVVKEAQNVSLKVSQHGNDLLIKLENGESLLEFPIRIKDGTRWYKKLHIVMDSIPMQLEPHGNNWILSPLPLIFNKDTKIAVVTVGDIKEKNRLIIHKQAGQYIFSRLRDDLMITTDSSLGKSNACTILLSNFYQEPKMRTLSLEFNDKTILLQKEEKEIDEAVVFCPRGLQINKEFSVDGNNLLSHYNCLKFDSDVVPFLRLNNSLLLLSERGKLLVSNYYSDVYEKWNLPVELNGTIIEPEEFREEAENANSLRYYQLGNEGLDIYHNQPDNKHQIGLIDLKNKSILDCSKEIIDGDLILLSGDKAITKVKNWNIYQHAREIMIFAFSDATIHNEKCVVSNCNPEDIVNEFKKETAKLINKKDEDSNTLLHHAVMKGELDKVKLLVGKGADIHEKNNFNMTSLDVAYKCQQKEVAKFLLRTIGNEGSKQRHRRHHIRHEDHHSRRRNYHSPVQEVTNSAVRASSLINIFANTIVGAVKGASQFISSLFKPAVDMEPSKAATTQGTDVNGTLFLLNVFIRKITGQKDVSTADQPTISVPEAVFYASDIINGFEKAVEQAASKSGMSMHRLNINFIGMEKEIAGKIIGGKFGEISRILKSYVEKACPGKEAGCPGKLSPKKFDKFMTIFNNRINITLDESILQILHSEHNKSKVKNTEEQQRNLKDKKQPRSYLGDSSVQGLLTQAVVSK